MFQFFPDPNLGRRAQIFEVWIRPVVPENAQMALRIAMHELEGLIQHGLTQEQFDATRNYLMKNVYVMTATQDQQLGYALDSTWYGMGEFTAEMRERFAKLRLADVNAAVRRHLSARDISIVIVTKDAQGLAEKLKADGFSTVRYDAEKPPELLAEDKRIGAEKLNIEAGAVRITPVDEVFAAPRHPYTEALLSAVPKPDPRLRARILLFAPVTAVGTVLLVAAMMSIDTVRDLFLERAKAGDIRFEGASLVGQPTHFRAGLGIASMHLDQLLRCFMDRNRAPCEVLRPAGSSRDYKTQHVVRLHG
jgi:hypothetical protein